MFFMIFLAPALVYGSQITTFFDRNKEGWFWYELILPPVEPEEVKEEPKIEKIPQKEEFVRVSVEDLRKLTAEELRILTDKAKDEALSKLDFDSTQYYMIVQKEVFARASIFGVLWKQVLWGTPTLDYSVEHPTSAIGISLKNQIDAANTANTLMEASNSSGFFFFFSSTCPYCVEQSRILKSFADKYNFRVIPVTLDGICLPEFPNCNADNGMAVKLNVDKTPAIYIAVPPEGLQLISSGIVSNSELEKRVQFFWNAYKEDRMGPGFKSDTNF
ncbi:MAG: hypothetical protein A2X93_09345 [Deltaproteobacteria bacterium GWC2_56_8]|nr:MAG: hypothetical protein A2X93_09345 [Deltaproteobacteria bacterium GWC2_56_8]